MVKLTVGVRSLTVREVVLDVVDRPAASVAFALILNDALGTVPDRW
jgi:hypothetical protein